MLVHVILPSVGNIMTDLYRRGNCEDLWFRVDWWSERTKSWLWIYVGTTVIVSDYSMCNDTWWSLVMIIVRKVDSCMSYYQTWFCLVGDGLDGC